MIKSNKGISLISLVITIAVMMIIASISINISFDRFEINNINKMINDIEFLKDKVSNYYLKYNTIPIVRDNDNNIIKYTYSKLTFDKNARDNENYYIIDLKAMDGISLNYGEVGFDNPNSSGDVYIINEKSHNIYYVKGIKFNGEYYHSTLDNTNLKDTIPPSKPEIKVISGTQNEEGIYTTKLVIEIIPGKDNLSKVDKTTYSCIYTNLDNTSTTITEEIEESTIINLTESGVYEIRVSTSDIFGNTSEEVTKILNINIPE